jgi:hypothetical protein
MKFNRQDTIDWLETNRANGMFEGEMEESMDFTKLSDEELEWYYYEWVVPSRAE